MNPMPRWSALALLAVTACTLRNLEEYADGEPSTSSGAGGLGGAGGSPTSGGASTVGGAGGLTTVGGAGGTGGAGGDGGCPVDPCPVNATCQAVDGLAQCVCDPNLVKVMDDGALFCATPYKSVSVGIDHACAVTAAAAAVEGEVHCWGRNWGSALGKSDDTTTIADDFELAPRPMPGYTFLSVAAGRQFTCGLTPTSAGSSNVACWGRNNLGQLGRGDTVAGLIPEPIVASTVDGPVLFTSVHVAFQHACAISVDGDLWCWGDNAAKQIQDSTTTSFSTPTLVAFGASVMTAQSKAKVVATSHNHTCAINLADELFCWGANGAQQVRAVSNVSTILPTAAEQRTPPLQWMWIDVAAGTDFSCGLARMMASPTSPGRYVCWGNSKTLATTSVEATMMDATFVGKARSHWANVCHLGDAGELACKGTSGLGQLGPTPELAQYALAHASDPTGTVISIEDATFEDVAVGLRAICGLGNDQAVRCWGADASTVLGKAAPASPYVPEEVQPPIAGSVWKSIDVSPLHACGLVGQAADTDGDLHCWGLNGDGELGVGGRATRTTPTLVPIPGSPGARWAEVAIGSGHSCAIPATRDKVLCWGLNTSLQAGPSGTAVYETPVAIEFPEPGTFSNLTAGDAYGCVRHDVAGVEKVECWGRLPGTSGGAAPAAVTLPVGFGPVHDLRGAGGHVCAIHGAARELSCWGENASGEVGVGTTTNSTAPLATGLTNVAQVALGANHTCASVGSVSPAGYCWGASSSGQAVGTPSMLLVPTPLNPPAYASVFPINTATTYGVDAEGNLSGWGSNFSGELLIGNTTGNNATHVALTAAPLGGENVTFVSGGDDGACALTADGRLFCWGLEFAGLRGRASVARSTPRVVDVPQP